MKFLYLTEPDVWFKYVLKGSKFKSQFFLASVSSLEKPNSIDLSSSLLTYLKFNLNLLISLKYSFASFDVEVPRPL